MNAPEGTEWNFRKTHRRALAGMSRQTRDELYVMRERAQLVDEIATPREQAQMEGLFGFSVVCGILSVAMAMVASDGLGDFWPLWNNSAYHLALRLLENRVLPFGAALAAAAGFYSVALRRGLRYGIAARAIAGINEGQSDRAGQMTQRGPVKDDARPLGAGDYVRARESARTRRDLVGGSLGESPE